MARRPSSEAIRYPELGARLRQARMAAGYPKMEAFAVAADVNPSTYRHQERGRSGLTRDVAARYAPLLGVRVEWLLYGSGPMRDYKMESAAAGPGFAGDAYAPAHPPPVHPTELPEPGVHIQETLFRHCYQDLRKLYRAERHTHTDDQLLTDAIGLYNDIIGHPTLSQRAAALRTALAQIRRRLRDNRVRSLLDNNPPAEPAAGRSPPRGPHTRPGRGAHD